MSTLYRYQPVIIDGPFGTDYHPQPQELIHLCEFDGWRYVVVPDGITPTIPQELTTWEIVVLTPELRESLKNASHLCAFAKTRFIDTIRSKYTLDDELYFARIATGTLLGSYNMQGDEPSLLTQYQTDVENARTILHQTYTDLGL